MRFKVEEVLFNLFIKIPLKDNIAINETMKSYFVPLYFALIKKEIVKINITKDPIIIASELLIYLDFIIKYTHYCLKVQQFP